MTPEELEAKYRQLEKTYLAMVKDDPEMIAMAYHPAIQNFFRIAAQDSGELGGYTFSFRRMIKDWEEQNIQKKKDYDRFLRTVNETNPPFWHLQQADRLENTPIVSLFVKNKIRFLREPYELVSYEESFRSKLRKVTFVFQWPKQCDSLQFRERVKIAVLEVLHDFVGTKGQFEDIVRQAVAKEIGRPYAVPVVRIKLIHFPDPEKPNTGTRIGFVGSS